MSRRAASPTPSQEPEIVASLRRILARIGGESSGVWMDLHITMPQMKVLLLLSENGSLRVGVLAKHLNVSTPTITGIVDRLVREDLVKREDDPSDRRVVLNNLTGKGQAVMERLAQRSDAEVQRMVGSLSAEEQTAIARSLKRLDEALTPAS